MDDVKKWVAGAAVVALVLLAAGWSLLVGPKRSEAAALREQVSAQELTTQQMQTRLQVLRDKAAKLPEQEAALAEVDRLVPHEPGMPDLVRALTEASRSAGVELVTVAPGTAVAVGTAAADPAAAAAAPADPAAAAAPPAAAPGLSAIPLSLKASGGFYELEQFVAELEDLPRALRVTSLDLTGASGAEGDVSPLASTGLTLSITAEVYVAPANAEASAPSVGAPAAGTAVDPAAAAPTAPVAPATSAAPTKES